MSGVITTQAQAVAFTPSAEGFGVVLGHDSIAQIAADIETARAAIKESQAALVPAKQLANGPGALGVDAVENATKQTAADQAALTLAQRKLTATLGPANGASVWTAHTVWDAPQDPTIPGRSLFALLRTGDIPEGVRLQALPVAANGELQGVLVRSSAVVASEGQYWCYLRKGTDSFTRAPITVDRPLAQGYFVPADRVAPGAEIVAAASTSLVRSH